MSVLAAAAQFSVGTSTAINWHRRWRDAGGVKAGGRASRRT